MNTVIEQMRRALVRAQPILEKASQDGMFFPDADGALREVDEAIIACDFDILGTDSPRVIGQRTRFDWNAAWAGFGVGVIATVFVGYGLLWSEICR